MSIKDDVAIDETLDVKNSIDNIFPFAGGKLQGTNPELLSQTGRPTWISLSECDLPVVLGYISISNDAPMELFNREHLCHQNPCEALGQLGPWTGDEPPNSLVMKPTILCTLWKAGALCSLPEVHDRTMALRRSVLQVARTLREASAPEYEALGPRCAILLALRGGRLYRAACL